MNIEKIIHRKASDYVAALHDPDSPELEPRKPGRPPLPDGQSATGHIQLRVTMARKNAYVRAARPGKLTEWIVRHLDKAAGYEEK